ncbi:10258_t:CDS:2 [Ambispora gerdemannii]|uniref:10258_t:CDS:1 n=1 Tax=Ambispora gerdemannii TaxID=144530 RepID=A0A9N9D528_9GLOM|nr:10258_t:CDS:2 [Ambispora gerdemannii]
MKFRKNYTKGVYSSLDVFIQFSPEIIFQILGQLTPSDIFTVALVNKHLYGYTRDDYLWHVVCVNQFGKMFAKKIITNLKENSKQIQCNWKQICIEQYRKTTFLAEKCEITSFWLHEFGIAEINTRDAYIVDYEKSKCGKIIQLPSQDERLYFLSLSAVLKNVLAGTYHVIWRMRIHHLSVLKGTKFITKVVDENINNPNFEPKQYIYHPRHYDYSQTTFEKGFVDYQLPFKLEIPSFSNNNQNCNVYLSFECAAGIPWFAHKLKLDFVYLYPCCNKPASYKRSITKMWSKIKHKLPRVTLSRQ